MPAFRGGRPLVLSWGLLGPGKGIEWGIEAMSQLARLGRMPRYLVAGQTHPKVLRREGEAYRSRLQERVMELGLATTVTFDGHYRHREALADLVASPNVVFSPMTRPTRSHRECSSRQSRRGVRSLPLDSRMRSKCSKTGEESSCRTGPDRNSRRSPNCPDAADRPGPGARWFGRDARGTVASRCRPLPSARRPVDQSASGGVTASGTTAAPVYDHLIRLTDDRGVFEHARYDEPRQNHGYCVDDVARALVVVAREPNPGPDLAGLVRRYLEFTRSALDAAGRSHNRMGRDGSWLDAPGLGDWWGRAIWGLGSLSASSSDPASRAAALSGFRIAAQQRSPHIRALALAALGAGEILLDQPAESAARRLLNDAVAAIGVDRPDFRLALARGSAELQQCFDRRSAAHRRSSVTGSGSRVARPAPAGLPAAHRDPRWASLSHPSRRPRPLRRDPGVRPATDRGRHARRRVCPRVRDDR